MVFAEYTSDQETSKDSLLSFHSLLYICYLGRHSPILFLLFPSFRDCSVVKFFAL